MKTCQSKAMSDVQARLLSNSIRCNPDDAVIALCSKEYLRNYHDRDIKLSLPHVVVADFSRNGFENTNLWNDFPELWWVDMRFNNLMNDASLYGFPKVLGLLDISNNPCCESINEEFINKLNKFFALRLKYSNEIPSPSQIQCFPYALVINDNFIRHSDRKGSSLYDASNTGLSNEIRFLGSNKAQLHGEWCTIIPGVRETNFFRAVQALPANKQLADKYLLDMVVEDYIEHTRIVNKYISDNNITNTKRMPTVIIDKILHLKHKCRNDLAVLLTASILFSIPRQIMTDACVVLLLPHFGGLPEILDLIDLPIFVKSGLVSLIKRICEQEMQEIHDTAHLDDKPRKDLQEMVDEVYRENVRNSIGDASQRGNVRIRTTILTPTFLDANGFYHMRTTKWYLNMNFVNGGNGTDGMSKNSGKGRQHIEHDDTDGFNESFSDLEKEILRNLPDIPTASDRVTLTAELRERKYDDWISFIARHATLLMTKSPACPSLVKPQHSLNKQEAYREMLPILQCAKMTYEDMEIKEIGPEKDGRAKTPVSKNGVDGRGLSDKGKAKLSATVGGSVLAFGSGIPNGVPDHLFWNTDAYITKRKMDQLHATASLRTVSSPTEAGRVSPGTPTPHRSPHDADDINRVVSGDSLESESLDLQLNPEVHQSSSPVVVPPYGQFSDDLDTGRQALSAPVSPSKLRVSTTEGQPMAQVAMKAVPLDLNTRPDIPGSSYLSEYMKNANPSPPRGNSPGSLHVTLPKPATIMGFSNDSEMTSSFILASKQTVRGYNEVMHFEHSSFLTQHSQRRSRVDCDNAPAWDYMHQPPVLVLPTTAKKFQDDSRILVETFNDIQEQFKESTVFEASNGQTQAELEAEVGFHSDGAGRHTHEAGRTYDPRPKELPLNGSTERETVAEATRRLLAEMGTLRNVRELNMSKLLSTSVNAKAKPMGPELPEKTSVVDHVQKTSSNAVEKNGKSEPSAKRGNESGLGRDVHASPVKFSWGTGFPANISRARPEEGTGGLDGQKSLTFLTGEEGVSNTQLMEQQNEDSSQQRQPPAQLLPDQSRAEKSAVHTHGGAVRAAQESIASHLPMTACKTLQASFNYGNIIVNSDVEVAQPTTTGAKLSGGNWYPCYDKIAYTLDNNVAETLLEKSVSTLSHALLAAAHETDAMMSLSHVGNSHGADNSGNLEKFNSVDLEGGPSVRQLGKVVSKLSLQPKFKKSCGLSASFSSQGNLQSVPMYARSKPSNYKKGGGANTSRLLIGGSKSLAQLPRATIGNFSVNALAKVAENSLSKRKKQLFDNHAPNRNLGAGSRGVNRIHSTGNALLPPLTKVVMASPTGGGMTVPVVVDSCSSSVVSSKGSADSHSRSSRHKNTPVPLTVDITEAMNYVDSRRTDGASPLDFAVSPFEPPNPKANELVAPGGGASLESVQLPSASAEIDGAISGTGLSVLSVPLQMNEAGSHDSSTIMPLRVVETKPHVDTNANSRTEFDIMSDTSDLLSQPHTPFHSMPVTRSNSSRIPGVTYAVGNPTSFGSRNNSPNYSMDEERGIASNWEPSSNSIVPLERVDNPEKLFVMEGSSRNLLGSRNKKERPVVAGGLKMKKKIGSLSDIESS